MFPIGSLKIRLFRYNLIDIFDIITTAKTPTMIIKPNLKNLKPIAAFVLAAFIAIACKNGKNTNQTGDAFDTIVVKGLYIHSDKLDSLRDCVDTSKVFYIKDETGTLSQRYDSLPGLQHTDEAVLVELRGTVEKLKIDSIAKTLPHTLKVHGIQRMERKNFQNTCIPYEFWALGNEPNWNVQISQAENLISFEDFNSEKTYRFNYKEPKISKDTTSWTYETRNTNERANIRVIIRKQECDDTMTDMKYKYSAEVLINGRNYRGCAISWK